MSVLGPDTKVIHLGSHARRVGQPPRAEQHLLTDGVNTRMNTPVNDSGLEKVPKRPRSVRRIWTPRTIIAAQLASAGAEGAGRVVFTTCLWWRLVAAEEVARRPRMGEMGMDDVGQTAASLDAVRSLG